MQRLEVSGAVRPIYGSLGVKWHISKIAQRVYDECLEISLVLDVRFPFFWDKMLHH